METHAKLLEESLLVIWNDRNAKSRSAAMTNIYAQDIHFYESDDREPIVGHEAINNLISVLQAQWPIDFKFSLSQSSVKNHAVQHIAWTLGAPGAEPVASGMDIAVIDDGKIKSLYLFLDKP